MPKSTINITVATQFQMDIMKMRHIFKEKTSKLEWNFLYDPWEDHKIPRENKNKLHTLFAVIFKGYYMPSTVTRVSLTFCSSIEREKLVFICKKAAVFLLFKEIASDQPDTNK